MPSLPQKDNPQHQLLLRQYLARKDDQRPLRLRQGIDCQTQLYKERLIAVHRQLFPSKRVEYWERTKNWLREYYPWVIIVILMIHLVRVKINVFHMMMEKYKGKALEIAETIKRENSLDFKFLLFSQFMRILFSNIAIP